MSSLSGKQVGDIKNLYQSIYTEETVEETVEVSYDEYSNEELLELFAEEVVNEVLVTLHENEYLSEKFVLDEGAVKQGFNLVKTLSRLTGFGRGLRRATKAEFKSGVRGSQRNVYPDKISDRGRVTPGGSVGDTRRKVTTGVLGGGITALLGNTDLGRSLMSRFGGAVKGAGQGFMQDTKSKTPKQEPGIYQTQDGTIRIR